MLEKALPVWSVFPGCAKSLFIIYSPEVKLFMVYSRVLLNKRSLFFISIPGEHRNMINLHILGYLTTLLVDVFQWIFQAGAFWPCLRWYVLMMATRHVSPNGEPTVAVAFPRPSSGYGCWTVRGLCSAAGGGEDKRLCVTEGWKKRVGNKEKIDYLPVTVCAWVVSQYFPVSLLHLRGVSDHISNLRPITDTQWF